MLSSLFAAIIIITSSFIITAFYIIGTRSISELIENIVTQNTESIKHDTYEYLGILNSINLITYELFLTNTIKENRLRALNKNSNLIDIDNKKVNIILSYFNIETLKKYSISKKRLAKAIKYQLYKFNQIKKVAKFSFLNSKAVSMIHYKNLNNELVSFKKMPDNTFSSYYSFLLGNKLISFWDHQNINYHYYDPKKFSFTNTISLLDSDQKHNEYWFDKAILADKTSVVEDKKKTNFTEFSKEWYTKKKFIGLYLKPPIPIMKFQYLHH